MLINSDRPQLYGTQINYDSETPSFFPIENPESIDKRRSEFGLMPLTEFAKSAGFEWNIKQKQ